MILQPSVQSAIDRGLRTSEEIQIEHARLRGDFEAVLRLVGFKGLDKIIATERQRLAERFPLQSRSEGFIS
jgi:hypothetical protein